MSAPELTVKLQGQGVVSADEFNSYEMTCDTAVQLRQFVGVTGIQVYIRGLAAPGDGGCGPFYWDGSSSGPDDGVNIIVPTAAAIGAWIRLTGVPAASAGGDLSGQYPNPIVVSTHLTSPLPINQGGTGRADGSNLVPTGVILPYGGSTAPAGWLLCYGQELSRTTYAALFAVFGITYGPGDGSTTFNMPDGRGRVIAGLDNMGGVAANRLNGAATGGLNAVALGDAGGEQTHTQTVSEMAPHDHNIGGRSLYVPGGVLPGGQGPTYSTTITGQSQGGGQAFNIVQPTIAMNLIAKT